MADRTWTVVPTGAYRPSSEEQREWHEQREQMRRDWRASRPTCSKQNRRAYWLIFWLSFLVGVCTILWFAR